MAQLSHGRCDLWPSHFDLDAKTGNVPKRVCEAISKKLASGGSVDI
jgi:hypothetical protein